VDGSAVLDGAGFAGVGAAVCADNTVVARVAQIRAREFIFVI
jgi:hypothetical protein